MNHGQPKKESGSTDDDATESTPTPAAVTTPTLVCSFCDKHLPLDKYKKCNCKTTIYCRNASCQKEHWKVHKKDHHKLCKALDATKDEGEEEDDTKSGSKNKTSSPTIQPKPIIQKEEKDECPICMVEIPLDSSKFVRMTCCGKGLHHHCWKQLMEVESKNICEYCPLCRTKVPTTDEEIIKRLQKWVKKQKAWAQCSLGHQYLHGNGVKQDSKRAFVLCTLSAEQGDANAQLLLGTMYIKGDGTKVDVKRAIELFTLAVEQGLASAQFNFGALYATGKGVEQSFTTAKAWFQKSAAQGHEGAIAALKQIEKDIKRTTVSAEQGLAKAQYNLGVMYANGNGVEQSFTTAQEWFQKAAAQGYEHAIAALEQVDKDIKRTTTTSTDDKKSISSTTTQNDNDKKSTSSSTTTQQEEDEDECPICLEVLPKFSMKFVRMICCGKGMHHACRKKKNKSRSMPMKDFCVLCRTKIPTEGSKESIEKLRFWIERGKAWSMTILGFKYKEGIGTKR